MTFSQWREPLLLATKHLKRLGAKYRKRTIILIQKVAEPALMTGPGATKTRGKTPASLIPHLPPRRPTQATRPRRYDPLSSSHQPSFLPAEAVPLEEEEEEWMKKTPGASKLRLPVETAVPPSAGPVEPRRWRHPISGKVAAVAALLRATVK